MLAEGYEGVGENKLTWILRIVSSPVQDLQWPGKVKSVEARVEAEEDLDDWGRTLRSISNCTHLDVVFTRKIARW